MSEFFHQFGIDWKLLLAQMVNFAILFFILRKYAYGPIISILAERKKKIEDGLAAAAASQTRLTEAENERQGILTDARKESVGIVSQSEKIAKEKGETIVGGAQKQAAEIVEEGKARAIEEKVKMKEVVWQESTAFLKSALARVVERSPESLDENLIKGVVEELKKV